MVFGQMGELKRRALFVAGTVSLGLGILGMVLPVVPTTPFLLLAAACYARSSKRFEDWLLGNRLFGRAVRDYREGRGVSLRVKVLAVLLLWTTIGCTVAFAVDIIALKAVLIVIALGVTVHIATLRRRAGCPSG